MRQTPHASRPHMPGYGILGPTEGTGLLPWSWAKERLGRSHDYWDCQYLARRPPARDAGVGVWLDDALWFSSSADSRKVRNLRHDPRCVATTDDAREPVVVEGLAKIVTDGARIAAFLAASNAKYAVDYGLDFLDPSVNATVRLVPRWAFGLTEADFTGSPTRWRFDPPPADG